MTLSIIFDDTNTLTDKQKLTVTNEVHITPRQ